ncbi:alpha/beta fold hydrolase [Denitrobaculum tricleocarpae]|uniref:Alpha/beta hydrolase n=1 Tax=Denitrobaculum tricleocarpae TaxID=2591009 RepID=A0A545TN22_9PROT|nr:alpha/beta fold hydrolase [Denitrobaculum tricleocarpae]TQV78627.1 alpha/beta hydrolase [Denitrobaculum tricleocarpae]
MNSTFQTDFCPLGPSGRVRSAPVMALHCSGANGTQWAHLASQFDSDTDFIAPNLVGPEAAAAGWSMQSYSLAEEARPLVERLLSAARPVHLVGHSYGGALALHIARHYPQHVASLCLYEPTCFSLLARSGESDQRLYRELETFAASLEDAIEEGHAAFAAEVFTDFWGGLGAWLALRLDRRRDLITWAPKAALDFGALLYEPQGPDLPLALPVTLLSGAQTRAHAKRVIALLAKEAPQANLVELAGVGHLGPFTVRDKVSGIIKDHLSRA